VMVAPVHDDAAMSGFLIGREENDPELEWSSATAHLDARRRDASVSPLRSLREFSFSSVGFSSLNTFSNSQRLLKTFKLSQYLMNIFVHAAATVWLNNEGG
jgi:hypothetical protein